MAKVELNTLVNEIRGQVDKVVLRKYHGRIILARKSVNEQEPSAAQVAHRKRFHEATDFGRLVMADDALRPLYEKAAQDREMPVFAVCIADFFNAPSITKINMIDYKGNVGDPIEITATDDMGVVRVNVSLSDEAQGTLIESGQAVAAGTGRWIYTATQAATPGSTVEFEVMAFDRPGGTAVERGTKRI